MKKNILLLTTLTLFACAKATNSSSSASTEACSVPGNIVKPSSLSPQGSLHVFKQNLLKQKKVEFDKNFLKERGLSTKSLNSDESISFAAGTEFVAVVDHECQNQTTSSKTWAPSGGLKISARFLNKKMKYNKISLQSHRWKSPRTYSLKQLEDIANTDPCLVQLGNPVLMYPTYTLSDPQVSNQNHLTTLNYASAGNIFWGTSGIQQDVTIAIIDSGVNIDHEDLSSQLWTNTQETDGNGLDDDGNGYIDDIYGWNFASNTPNPRPQSWGSEYSGQQYHGSHVAGLAAGTSNNNLGGSGIMGLHSKVMSLNVFGSNPYTQDSTVDNAIYYAINNGADVINLSLGGPGVSSSTRTALEAAVSSGIVVVAAAGNDSSKLTDSDWFSPASYAAAINGMISVGALYSNTGTLTSYSNYGSSFVEIAAPGSDSNGVGLFSLTSSTSSYARSEGTSMASPVVAGAAALVVGYIRSQSGTVSPALVEYYLKATGTQNSSLSGSIYDCRSLSLDTLSQQLDADF